MNTSAITHHALEGEHVRLEPLSLDHVDGLSAIGIDPELWQWTLRRVESPEAMRAYVDDALALADSGHALPYATIDRRSGMVVGSTRFGSIDREHRRMEIGWTWIGRQWQRTVINTEAKYLMLRHAFETLDCIRIELKTDALNERSRAAIRRIGAREEGTLRHHMITASGRVRDTVFYSILRDEWPDVRQRLEDRLTRTRHEQQS